MDIESSFNKWKGFEHFLSVPEKEKLKQHEEWDKGLVTHSLTNTLFVHTSKGDAILSSESECFGNDYEKPPPKVGDCILVEMCANLTYVSNSTSGGKSSYRYMVKKYDVIPAFGGLNVDVEENYALIKCKVQYVGKFPYDNTFSLFSHNDEGNKEFLGEIIDCGHIISNPAPSFEYLVVVKRDFVAARIVFVVDKLISTLPIVGQLKASQSFSNSAFGIDPVDGFVTNKTDNCFFVWTKSGRALCNRESVNISNTSLKLGDFLRCSIRRYIHTDNFRDRSVDYYITRYEVQRTPSKIDVSINFCDAVFNCAAVFNEYELQSNVAVFDTEYFGKVPDTNSLIRAPDDNKIYDIELVEKKIGHDWKFVITGASCRENSESPILACVTYKGRSITVGAQECSVFYNNEHENIVDLKNLIKTPSLTRSYDVLLKASRIGFDPIHEICDVEIVSQREEAFGKPFKRPSKQMDRMIRRSMSDLNKVGDNDISVEKSAFTIPLSLLGASLQNIYDPPASKTISASTSQSSVGLVDINFSGEAEIRKKGFLRGLVCRHRLNYVVWTPKGVAVLLRRDVPFSRQPILGRWVWVTVKKSTVPVPLDSDKELYRYTVDKIYGATNISSIYTKNDANNIFTEVECLVRFKGYCPMGIACFENDIFLVVEDDMNLIKFRNNGEYFRVILRCHPTPAVTNDICMKLKWVVYKIIGQGRTRSSSRRRASFQSQPNITLDNGNLYKKELKQEIKKVVSATEIEWTDSENDDLNKTICDSESGPYSPKEQPGPLSNNDKTTNRMLPPSSGAPDPRSSLKIRSCNDISPAEITLGATPITDVELALDVPPLCASPIEMVHPPIRQPPTISSGPRALDVPPLCASPIEMVHEPPLESPNANSDAEACYSPIDWGTSIDSRDSDVSKTEEKISNNMHSSIQATSSFRATLGDFGKSSFIYSENAKKISAPPSTAQDITSLCDESKVGVAPPPLGSKSGTALSSTTASHPVNSFHAQEMSSDKRGDFSVNNVPPRSQMPPLCSTPIETGPQPTLQPHRVNLDLESPCYSSIGWRSSTPVENEIPKVSLKAEEEQTPIPNTEPKSVFHARQGDFGKTHDSDLVDSNNFVPANTPNAENTYNISNGTKTDVSLPPLGSTPGNDVSSSAVDDHRSENPYPDSQVFESLMRRIMRITLVRESLRSSNKDLFDEVLNALL